MNLEEEKKLYCILLFLLGVNPKSHNVPHRLEMGKTYEYINMDNIQLVRDLLGQKLKNKTMRA